MTGDTVTVQPDYTKSGIEASKTIKNRASDNGAEYPVDISGHLLQVEYTFERDFGGLLQLHGIRYYCERCGEEKSISEQGNLREFPKTDRRKVRQYLIGYFTEIDCADRKP
jgi:hypothetical protein